jgi:hypothetical protein
MQTAIPTTPAASALAILGNIHIESLTISCDVMPHHFIANAKISDLAPSQLVAAMLAAEDAIKITYPQMHCSGWSAKSDGLRIYFHAWTLAGGVR